jgi:predicted HicB family RNase H-like nuclease
VSCLIETCKKRGQEPEGPFKGTFNIRVGSDLHQRIALNAVKKGITINRYIVDILEKETAHG